MLTKHTGRDSPGCVSLRSLLHGLFLGDRDPVKGRASRDQHALLGDDIHDRALVQTCAMNSVVLSVFTLKSKVALDVRSPHSLVECIHAEHVFGTA